MRLAICTAIEIIPTPKHTGGAIMSFSENDDHVRVRLQNISVDVHCGLHPWERHPERPNRLLINVDLYAPLRNGPMEPQGYINYDRVRDFLKNLGTHPHIDLLETLVDEIVAECFRLDRVEACRVSVLKQTIFNETE